MSVIGKVFFAALAASAMQVRAERLVAREDYDVSAVWDPVPIKGRTLYCNIGWGWEELHAVRPDLAMFDHPYISVGGSMYVNDIARFNKPDPPKNAWTNLPVRFSEVFASRDWKGARRRLAVFEKHWPDSPFSIYLHRPPESALKGPFLRDIEDFKAWRSRHPGFYTFELFGEYDSAIHGFTCNRINGIEYPDLLKRCNEQYGDDPLAYGFPRRCIDVDYAKAKAYYFGSDDTMGLWTVVPSFGHHEARKGFKFLFYEAEHATTASPWRWGGMYGRGATRQYRVAFGWYSAMYTSSSRMRDGRTAEGIRGVRIGRDSFTYWPNPRQPDRVPHLGSSRSLLRRNVRYGFFIGGQLPQIECSQNSLYATAADGKGWTLSPYGEDFNDVFEWCRHYDRGVVYAPVAFLTSIDENVQRQCYNTFPAKDEATIPSFLFTLVPSYSSNKAGFYEAWRGFEGCLWNSEFGEIADVVCPDGGQPTDVFRRFLDAYKAAFLIGYHNPTATDTAALEAYVRAGGTIFCSCDQVTDGLVPPSVAGVAFGTETVRIGEKLIDEKGRAVETFAEPYSAYAARPRGAKPLLTDENGTVVAWTAACGKGRVVTVAVRRMMPDAFKALREDGYRTQEWFENPAYYATVVTGRRRFPIVRHLLRRVQRDTMPLTVTGDIQWGLNKTAKGWMLWLINNKGIAKFALEPEELDLSKTATVTVDLRSLAGLTVTDISAPTPAGARPVAVKDGRFTVKVRPGEDRRIAIE